MKNKFLRTGVWEVQYLTPPPAVRYCKKCGRQKEFVSSGQFRVNAQRKYLDVWLIYKCFGCEATWNLTVLSRIHPKAVSRELLDKFHGNDQILAHKYAMNTDLLKRNGCKIGPYDYKITGCAAFDGPVRLHIRSNDASDVKVSAILREKLQLSRKEFEDMLSDGRIQSESENDLTKCRLGKEILLVIS